eukprot:TRINITY_DN1295_c0_g1_i1.p2 TRINITY_DN1295_c0_g1~~TRINITY_DN1295_c0_g1_i1.p2  ORF type:complete len:300 (-),score=29.21 TRINITY_DN1295_c0_g1_i1:2937-3836(-)
MEDDYSNITYLARFCLLLLCKTLQNQVILVRFNVALALERFHMFPIRSDTEFKERVRWLCKFAKQSSQLALEEVANSLAVTAINLLQKADYARTRARCLKAISYLYMTGLCSEERYKPSEIKLIIKHLIQSMETKEARYIKNALRAAGSLLMQEDWGKQWPQLVDQLIAQLVECQELQLEQISPEVQKQINNIAKLILTLTDESTLMCIQKIVVIRKGMEEEAMRKMDLEGEKAEMKAENILKAVLLKSLKCEDVLLLCIALRSIGIYAHKTNCQDKGFMHIAIEVFSFLYQFNSEYVN